MLFKYNNYLSSILPVSHFYSAHNCLILIVTPSNLIRTMKFLKLHLNCNYSLLTSISGIDYPFRSQRFEIVYELLSIHYNARIRIKTFINEVTPLISIFTVFSSSTWWEREIWDLFGVFFFNNKELNRILTDYGFEGHPLRKDFPLSGFIEVRYDDQLKRVVCEPLEYSQSFRFFDFSVCMPLD